MKVIILFFSISVFPFLGNSQRTELESLEETYKEWIKAWNDKDEETVTKISWGNYGFGRDDPFLRGSNKDSVSYQNNIKKYMDSMSVIIYREHFTKYKIIDGVGFVNGFYAQTTKQKTGPLRTVYGRQSLVFIKESGIWRMKHYHRSILPNEFIR